MGLEKQVFDIFTICTNEISALVLLLKNSKSAE